MGGDFDHSDFVDPDFDPSRRAPSSPPAAASGPFRPSGPPKPPSRAEIDDQVTAAQKELVELKQRQGELERERTQLEESRRRRLDFEQGRQEMLVHLTRGVALIDEQEQNHRRDAEQLSRTLAELRDALQKVSTLDEQSWTVDNYQTELTRALTLLESARMEWNSARLKWPILANANPPPRDDAPAALPAASPLFGASQSQSPSELARLGLALTWPVATAVLVVGLALAAVLARR